MSNQIREIGDIGNYYGCLEVKVDKEVRILRKIK